MGKASMCIRMLEIMNTGRLFKISELADLLETNPRNIVEYKKELEEAGYYIVSVPGRYGGYKLEKTVLLPTLKLLPEEKESVIEWYNYGLAKKDFVNKSTFIRAFGKISSSIELPMKEDNLLVIDHYQLSMSEDEIQKRYSFIEDAIEKKQSIEIEYQSIKNGTKTHVLDPYKLFIYNNSWFFLAWNQEVGDVWYFKLNRILSWKLLTHKFRIWKGFKAESYFDGNGFKNNGDFHHIEFYATGVRKHLLKERVYGKNQEVIDIDDETVKCSLDMQNKESIVSFALSCGSDIKIIEPDWLKNKVSLIAYEIYKKNTEVKE